MGDKKTYSKYVLDLVLMTKIMHIFIFGGLNICAESHLKCEKSEGVKPVYEKSFNISGYRIVSELAKP